MLSNCLTDISKISDRIYLSGIYPLDNSRDVLGELGINCILACVERTFVSETHAKALANHPNMVILYLPYIDDTKQNLWTENKNTIEMIQYTNSLNKYNEINKQLNLYNNKPLIEIGYNFIDNAITSKKNILVHCMAGVSRSASVVIYYFMKKYGLSYNRAEKMVKDKRSIINPNVCFKEQLLGYQKKRDKFSEQDVKAIIKQ